MRMRASELIAALARTRRTILRGGAAIIAHGHSRTTEDIDVWCDPTPSPQAWAEGILQAIGNLSTVQLLRPGGGGPGWKPILPEALGTAGGEDGMIRLRGAEHPVDVFYAPNETAFDAFDEAWERGTPLADGTRLMEEVDLLLTKQATGRPQDEADIAFLEGKVNDNYFPRLQIASAEEARALLSRYATPTLLPVRQIAAEILRELESGGDPFAAEYLRELQA